jgi:hypothetical protein
VNKQEKPGEVRTLRAFNRTGMIGSQQVNNTTSLPVGQAGEQGNDNTGLRTHSRGDAINSGR